jgi:hypothetical protein
VSANDIELNTTKPTCRRSSVMDEDPK